MPAGVNERHFRDLITEKFGNILLGKGSWRTPRPNTVSISIDNRIETENYRLLIEIDSGNYAKLIVGQYMLINGLNLDETGHRRDVLVFIHYNARNTQRPYNPERTLKNLRYCNQTFLEGNGALFLAFNIGTFTDFISHINSVEELDTRIRDLLVAIPQI
jgi:hypothetical protein